MRLNAPTTSIRHLQPTYAMKLSSPQMCGHENMNLWLDDQQCRIPDYP
jgi:hypothetical protein